MMSKRNTIIFITILVIVGVVIFWFISPKEPNTGEENPGTLGNLLIKFNPFSRNQTENNVPAEPTPNEPRDAGPRDISEGKLHIISSMPVAGFGLFEKERIKDVLFSEEDIESGEPQISTEVAPAIRYVDKSNGNIYQTFLDKINEERFSKTIIPRVHEAYFGENSETVLMRSLKRDESTIITFAGTLPEETASTQGVEIEIAGSFLADNITDLSFSPDKSSIFQLVNLGGMAIGTTSDILGLRKIQVFDSPFTEWLSQWPGENLITLTTKPSGIAPGYMYSIDPRRKDFTKVLGEINGLTTLTSPNGELVLFNDNTLALNIYNIRSKELVGLSTRTMPEKCVWDKASTFIFCSIPKTTPAGLYPDDWYKGKVSFSDEIWKIDATTGAGSVISDLVSERGEEVIDGIRLTLNENEDKLFFINKKDGFLWMLDLN